MGKIKSGVPKAAESEENNIEKRGLTADRYELSDSGGGTANIIPKSTSQEA